MRRSRARTVVLGILAVALAEAPAAAEELVQAFTLREAFGVSHPDQIIDFDLQKKVDPAACVMLGPDGKEAPYQLIEDGTKVAVRTDLPAGAEKSWRLISGRRGPRTPTQGLEAPKEAGPNCRRPGVAENAIVSRSCRVFPCRTRTNPLKSSLLWGFARLCVRKPREPQAL